MSTTTTHTALEVLFSRDQIARASPKWAARSTGTTPARRLFSSACSREPPSSWPTSPAASRSTTPSTSSLSPATARAARTSGAVKLIKDLDNTIEGKNVIIVEDILDTGLTLNFLRGLFEQHQPKTLRIAALLDKPSRRVEKIDADYVGFTIPNQFVIGYGMDFAERYRNLPDICLMPPDAPGTIGRLKGVCPHDTDSPHRRG